MNKGIGMTDEELSKIEEALEDLGWKGVNGERAIAALLAEVKRLRARGSLGEEDTATIISPPSPSIAITPAPFSVYVDNHPEVGLPRAPRWVLAISHDEVLVHDDKERRLVWVPMANCCLKLADS